MRGELLPGEGRSDKGREELQEEALRPGYLQEPQHKTPIALSNRQPKHEGPGQ